MSEGEVEVASSAYEVLPKEVLAEVGSVKLFSTSSPRTR
jgi:small subunit ribosomal protein S5e